MDEKVLEQFKEIVTAVVAPVAADAKAALAAVATMDEKIETKAREAASAVIKDARGRRFPLGDGSGTGKGQAPAYVRPEALGDRPLTITSVFQSFRDEKVDPLVQHVSDELEMLGHQKTAAKSILYPLSLQPKYIGAVNQKGDNLIKLLKHALPVPEDMEETMQLAEQYPEFFGAIAKATGAYRSKAMDALDDTAGGALIPLPTTGELIEFLRKVTVFGRVDAEQIPLPPQGTIRWPRETGATTFGWLGSNDTITDSAPATGSLTLVAKRVGGLIKVPNDLLRYGLGAEAIVRRALTLDAGLAEDLAFLEGQGGSNVPLGIIRSARSANDTPTADSVTLHNAGTTATDGDTFLPKDPLKMMALVEEAPDSMGPNAFVMRPLLFAAISNMRADAVTAGDGAGPFMFNVTRDLVAGQGVSKVLAGLPVVTSTQVNNTSRKGSGTALTYILCGNFRRFVIGRVGSVELAVSEHAGFAADQTWLRAILRVDAAMKYPQAFVVTPTLLIP